MKVLLLDGETTQGVAMVYSQSQVLLNRNMLPASMKVILRLSRC